MGVIEPCQGCRNPRGEKACLALFEAMIARDYSDQRFFSSHRLFMDSYCLQHPDLRCVSAKSLAAHLAGLCQILEQGTSEATGSGDLRRWLNGAPRLEKPELPEERGALTLDDLADIDDPIAWRDAVRRWAESVWAAYAGLHPLARNWLAEAQAASR